MNISSFPSTITNRAWDLLFLTSAIPSISLTASFVSSVKGAAIRILTPRLCNC